MEVKKRIKDILIALKNVYQKPLYIALASFTTLLILTFNISIINYRVYLNFPSFEIISKIFIGTFLALPVHSIMLLLIASILSGIFVSLLVYQLKTIKSMNKSYATGAGGIVLGTIAPACASCGIGLLALLGYTGLIAVLPFKGLEVGYLGIVLLIIAISSISAKISNKTCNISNAKLIKYRK